MRAALAAAGRIFAGFTPYSPFFSSLFSRPPLFATPEDETYNLPRFFVFWHLQFCFLLATAGRIFARFTRYSPFFSSLLSRAVRLAKSVGLQPLRDTFPQNLDLHHRLLESAGMSYAGFHPDQADQLRKSSHRRASRPHCRGVRADPHYTKRRGPGGSLGYPFF